MKWKFIGVKILAVFFRQLSQMRYWIWRGAQWWRGPFIYLGRGLFKVFIFPAYRSGHWAKYRFLSFYSPLRRNFFGLLNKTYVIHVLVGLIALSVVTQNLQASNLRQEDFGEGAVIYSLMSGGEFEELTEEVPVVEAQGNIRNYLDQSNFLGSPKTMGGTPAIEEPLLSDLATITQGGTSMSKPNILKPIEASLGALPDFSGQSHEIVKHRVLAGETVSSIAKKYNVSVETILWQNNFTPNSIIRPGNIIEILPITGVAHKIKRGETVGSIAKQYQVEVDKIISYNNLFNASDVQVNQILIIPGGKKISPYASVAKTPVPQTASIKNLFATPTGRVSASGFIWPTAVFRISQYYSWRHHGLDVAGPAGTAIYAAANGTVSFSGWSSNGYGYNMIVNHGNGVKTHYAHFRKLYVNKGDQVVQGQVLGEMGSTGRSTGPHLHFEVVINGVLQNPLTYVK